MKRAQTETQKSEREAQIIQSALEQFFQNGFSATTMESIGRHAGISKGTLYLYFDSKESLFIAIIKTIAIPQIEHLEALLIQKPSVLETLALLQTELPRLLRVSQLPKVAKVLISDAFIFPEVVRHYRTHVVDRGLSAVANCLRRGMDNRELVPLDPEMTARLVFAPVLMSAIWTLVFDRTCNTQLNLELLFETQHKILIRALTLDEASHV